ncbi:MAG TPA: phospholipid carrier-dependent glycosyltransferase [Holophaga sp.]|nr:phospholipid carrier-dependent glycosyltransferase [Holophaga sp.]
MAAIVQEMLQRGDLVVPTLNGAPYLEKPPLYHILAALACGVTGGVTPWGLRLPSALLALATGAWVAWIALRQSSFRAAGWAGFLLLSSFYFFEIGETAVVDMTLTAAASLALGAAYLAIREPEGRDRWVRVFWVGVGAAFLAKGVVGPAVVLAPVAAALLMFRRGDLAGAFLRPNAGMAFSLVLSLAWVILLAAAGGRFYLAEVFLHNAVGRLYQHPEILPSTGLLGEHVEPWYYYLLRMPAKVLPWFAAWAAALVAAIPRPGASRRLEDVFLPLAFAVNLLAFSLSDTKREVYLLPVLPVSFLHVALWLDRRVPRRPGGRDPWLFGILGFSLVLATLMSAVLPWVMARDGLFSGPTAAFLACVSLILGLITARRHWRRDAAGLLRGAMGIWAFCLVVMVGLAAPAMDRRVWRPIMDPFRRAAALREAGASVAAAGLSEPQVGAACLTLGAPVRMLDSVEEARAFLAGPGPAVLVTGRRWWKEAGAKGLEGVELPQTGDALARQRLDRIAVLVANPAAAGGRNPIVARLDRP